MQRAAKRLAEKGLIERCYIRGETTFERTRTYLSVRIPPTPDELADTADLREMARQNHIQHLEAGLQWIRKWGQTSTPAKGLDERVVRGYWRAAHLWNDPDDDDTPACKWLKWFDQLNV